MENVVGIVTHRSSALRTLSSNTTKARLINTPTTGKVVNVGRSPRKNMLDLHFPILSNHPSQANNKVVTLKYIKFLIKNSKKKYIRLPSHPVPSMLLPFLEVKQTNKKDASKSISELCQEQSI